MSKQIDMNISTLIGIIIVLVSSSILFGQFYVPIAATFFGISVTGMAVAWFILGASMVVSGVYSKARAIQ